MPCPCIIVLAIIQDRERTYIHPHMKSTQRVSSTVFIRLQDDQYSLYDRHRTNTVQVRIIHGHLPFLYFLC